VLYNLQLCSIWGLSQPLKNKILKESSGKEYGKVGFMQTSQEIHQPNIM
jgi:hypothetical protein